jgi:hypothetical protein
MPTCKCPNCGARLEYRFLLYLDEPRQRVSPGLFQSTAPTGLLRSFVHRVVRNRPLRRPETPGIVVRSEIKTSRYQTLINEYKLDATPAQLKALAILYVERGEHWSRDTTHAARVGSTTWHNKIALAFRELRFLEQYQHNRFRLTDAGKRFLRHYL